MKKKILILYKKLRNISASYLIYQSRNNIELVKEVIPEIQEVVLWFLQENMFGIEQELYQELSVNLLYILDDISFALDQGDKVLMHDAIANGLMEYLELFIEPVQEDMVNDSI